MDQAYDNDYDDEVIINMANRCNQNNNSIKKKRLSKREKKRLRRKRILLKIFRIFLILGLFIALAVFAFVSPIFNISTIEVENNNQLTSDTIISLSGLKEGQNIFKFWSKNVENKIKENPYIEEVNVKRKLPNKVEIKVEERNKDFNVEYLNGYAYINRQGYILEISSTKQDLITIKGIITPVETLVAGNRLNNEDLKKLETVIQIVDICKNYDLDKKITYIDITNENEYLMYLEQEQKLIHIGDSSNISDKILYVQAIVESNKGKKGEIYVNGNINNGFKPRFKEN